MNYLICETVYDDNGNCDDMGVNPLCMVIMNDVYKWVLTELEEKMKSKRTVTIENIKEFFDGKCDDIVIVEFDKMVYV